MIPARYGASRFPGKLMQDLGGKPVIVRTYEAAKATDLFDEVYVVTDSDVIFREIEMNGGKAIMSQKEHDCGSDRIAEAVENMDVDIVVNVQGDEPFTSREGLEKVLAVFNEPDADKIDLASLMTEIHDWKEISDPNCVKVIVDKDNFALYFSRSPIPYPRDKNVDIQYYKHKGIYAFRKQAIMDFYHLPMRSLEAVEKIECIRYLEYGKNIKMAVSNTTGVEIDTPEDLVKANKILKENKSESVNNKFRNFPMVPKVVFGEGCFDQLSHILSTQKQEKAPFIFLVDAVFKNNTEFLDRINLRFNDKLIFVSAEEEPKTSQVDNLVNDIKAEFTHTPSGIIGIGGGTVMDLAKAVSIMLTNNGSAADYQGWDLVNKKAVYHVGIPTISGTGAEVSRTTVLTGPVRKLGINSDFTPFDQVILDPELTIGVSKNQWFYTGMDCFIHCVESLNGTFLNAFSQSYGEKAYDLCMEIFLGDTLSEQESRAKLMMASWHGGMSIAYSQVGVAHAMSYGLGYVLGTKHGIGNCIVFEHLEEFYPKDVKLFKQMVTKHGVEIPKGICKNLTEEQMQTMITVALGMVPLWENALGSDWKKIITPAKLRAMYLKM
ncbi:3-deoxy-manno-octulosonate cytidylyltransferase [Aequorivita sp. CIP111184]|uniref:3-deoxy-manno-octulosonate cytidylyltransferase n=1 Tax=Aequorivita sp. CIP111184 TaxID=2211356 RepID=UPI000DBBF0C5|nr:3-deoxy-manno-octulosonate cytidylyltransferase [Aequorivita sp. CIP111184]SRX55965.1 3-deoxy-alpha-D-manno-octulosonate 8-oxidase [Aequorivita sp. CIP111184]